jgi:transposase
VAAVSLLETLTPAQRISVKVVAMDMWPAYMSAARQCMPQADIVHDKFHVSKYLGEAVDAVRRQEHRKLSQAGTSPLKGSKWAWLRKYLDGRSAEAVSFRALNQLNLKTSRAWRIKENFSQFWSYSYKGAAKPPQNPGRFTIRSNHLCPSVEAFLDSMEKTYCQRKIA